MLTIVFHVRVVVGAPASGCRRERGSSCVLAHKWAPWVSEPFVYVTLARLSAPSDLIQAAEIKHSWKSGVDFSYNPSYYLVFSFYQGPRDGHGEPPPPPASGDGEKGTGRSYDRALPATAPETGDEAGSRWEGGKEMRKKGWLLTSLLLSFFPPLNAIPFCFAFCCILSFRRKKYIVYLLDELVAMKARAPNWIPEEYK